MDADGFEYGGIWILDRTKSPCGRFDLTPEEADNLYGKDDSDASNEAND